MHVLVCEHPHWGHHHEFMGYLVAGLLGAVDRVSVAVTPAGQRSANFREYLAPLAERVEVAPILREIPQSPAVRRALSMFQEFERAASEIGPDYVMLPSADSATFGAFLDRFRPGRSVFHHLPAEVCLHSGPGGEFVAGLGQRARAMLQPTAYRVAPWRRIHMINPLAYEVLRGRGTRLPIGTLPSPVTVAEPKPRGECRARLGLPEDGRLLVAAGGLDRQEKGTDRLLAAFRRLRREPGDRLLLAGRCAPGLVKLVESDYGDLVAAGQLLMLNRFLSDEDMGDVFSAADVVCVPYPGFRRLSGILTRGVAAGRPVLSNSAGWMGAVVRRFGLGWQCDAADDEKLVETAQAALDGCRDYVQGESGREFARYHAMDNFHAHWLVGLAEYAGLKGTGVPFTWEQLLERCRETAA